MIILLLLLFIPTANSECLSCGKPCGVKGHCDDKFKKYWVDNCEVWKCEDGFHYQNSYGNSRPSTGDVYNSPIVCMISKGRYWNGIKVWKFMDDIAINLYPAEFYDLKFYCIPDKPVPDGAINSECDPPNPMCEQIHFDPYKKNKCKGEALIEYGINKVKSYTRHIEFDKKDAVWRATGNGNEYNPAIPDRSNAYCIYPCDKSKLFLSPDKCDSGEQCIEPIPSQAWLYECPADYRMFVQYASEGIQTMVPSVECVLGKYQADNREPVSAKCVKVYCKHRNPLKSECPISHSTCSNVTFDDEQTISCPDNYLIVEEGKEEMKYTSLKCNKDSGKWFGTRETDSVQHSFNDLKNIFCMDLAETTTAIAIVNTTVVEPLETTTEVHTTPIEKTTQLTRKEVPTTLPTTEVAETSTASVVALSLMLATAGALLAIAIILLICAIVLCTMLRRVNRPNRPVISSTQFSLSMPSTGRLTLDRNSEKKETWDNRKSKERRLNKGNKSIHAEIPSELSKKEESKSSKKIIRPNLEAADTLGSFDS
ncbi:hypothetical protein PRIPAC_74551 [Pristionchus pacificus]|uniref:Uncharacterized protein n=1 Tax=Pristionchus pacificus TaxID=54126 RepID=A0A2A6C0L0_PRIPA|nr:hypothetical protein PRIPAC_74551 [Pristionchus pacificus]|eukprot:PDM71627.1 hypothetical protein PRIPAC_38034 [Pristionchus pacificus]